MVNSILASFRPFIYLHLFTDYKVFQVVVRQVAVEEEQLKLISFSLTSSIFLFFLPNFYAFGLIISWAKFNTLES